MKITFEVVRSVLRDTLGFHSFVAGFIKQIREDRGHPTAGITAKGELIYNPEFVNNYVTFKEDLFSLIFHEILHPLFGHFIHGEGELENIAADAVINAVITTLYPDASGNGNLFKKVHSPEGLAGLMRPQSRMHGSSFYAVYSKLYYAQCASERMTTGELIRTLKIFVPTVPLYSVLLIGTHASGNKNASSGTCPGLSGEILERVLEDVRQSLKRQIQQASGYSAYLVDMVLEALHSHRTIRRLLLQQFVTRQKLDCFQTPGHRKRNFSSPLPLHPSKRDLVLLAADLYPTRFRNQMQLPKPKKQGIAIYLDVSGSVEQYLPQIIGILANYKQEIQTLFLFSNKAVETSFHNLLKGNIKTTGGTDFNCVAESILERGFERAVIITDGYAWMKSELQEQLKARQLSTLTILFGRQQTCDEFAPFGEVVHLEDICE